MGKQADDDIARALLLSREKKMTGHLVGYPRRQWFSAWNAPPKRADSLGKDQAFFNKKNK